MKRSARARVAMRAELASVEQSALPTLLTAKVIANMGNTIVFPYTTEV